MYPTDPDQREERLRMVSEQLEARGISGNNLLQAFRKVKRHLYVPEGLRAFSYSDMPLSIGNGQTISQPYMVALMTMYLDLKGTEKVLEVGTGSGYQAAILSLMCGKVYSIERDAELLERARKVLAEEGRENIRFACGDGTQGWKEKAPFDGIIVTAGAPHVPSALKEQLSGEGRMTIPVGDRHSQELLVIKREGNGFFEERVCGCVFVPLVGEDGWGGGNAGLP